MNRSFNPKAARSLLLALPAAVLLCLGVSAATATPAIEGVWSFNGGAVDIQAQPGSTFRGVVTSPTKFAQCSHPVNEDMWTEMRLQADGSYFGLHQWYFEGSCALNPTLGPTAWRVLQSSTGSRFLRVCFSAPGSNSQPTIAADGSSAHVTYGCTDSASIAPLPAIAPHEGAAGSTTTGQISFRQTVGLPTPHKCVRRRTLKIVLRDPAYDPLKEVVIHVNGHKVVDIRSLKKLKKPIVLRNLPSGSFRIKVLAITVLNQRLSGSRAYHSCKGSGKIKLRRTKHGHTHGTHGK
ncbi:MAG TPA: hypothetical protein VFV03_07805 [Solirubrobacteraceae bacterium]|nr:hypothetical protein [Solirubrobacteraceae bacterium]